MQDKQLIDAARYAAFYIREYDVDYIHDGIFLDPGFKVAEDGRCDNPDCVLCSLERILDKLDPPSNEEEISTINLNVKEAQLLLTL